MLHGVDFRRGERQRANLYASFALLIALAFSATSATPLMAQEKLNPGQEKTLAQCLSGCNKGDANCQDTCTGKTATPAFVSAAGSCVRACADALAGPGQQQSRVEDLVQCVRACN